MGLHQDKDRDWMVARERMVDRQLVARGIRDERVLNAFRRVPRHLFVDPPLRAEAYSDFPLPIGGGQTISQPYIVAAMVEAMEVGPDSTVLEIGTGSGYETAILAELTAVVHTIEVVPELARQARHLLTDLGYSNIRYRVGDGTHGWPEAGPFGAIVVSAAPRRIADDLLAQLVEGGCCLVPEGEISQMLKRYRRIAGEWQEETLMPVRFVPLVGSGQSG